MTISKPQTPSPLIVKAPSLSTHNGTRVRERELLRVAAELAEKDPKVAVEAARHEVLLWAAQQIGNQLPNAAFSGHSFEHLCGGRICIGVSFEDKDIVLWALRVDKPDTDVAQRIWTTEIVTGYAPGNGPVLFSLRLLVSTPESYLSIEPAVPRLVGKIAKICGLQQNGNLISDLPWYIASEFDAENLIEELINPARSLPYLVCSIAEGEIQPRVDTTKLSKATLGIAKIVVLPATLTWVLTQRLGKPLSVYNGAVRAYLPGFSYDSDPYIHRLIFFDSQDNKQQQQKGESLLRWLVANESLRRLKLGNEVVAFSQVRDASMDIERERLKENGMGVTEQLMKAQVQIKALKEDVTRSNGERDAWMSEYETADDQAKNLEQQLWTAQSRIQQLIEQLKARGGEPDSDVKLPDNWEHFAEWCDDVLSGRITLTSKARREVKSAVFDEPQTAATCLLWLANEYRDSRLHGSTGDLRKPLQSGIQNERLGGDCFEFKWNGHNVQVEWHIKNGGNTRDPHHCLRIYYFWDDDNQTVVIVSMPAHIHTSAT
jgi:hypothetical protein